MSDDQEGGGELAIECAEQREDIVRRVGVETPIGPVTNLLAQAGI